MKKIVWIVFILISSPLLTLASDASDSIELVYKNGDSDYGRVTIDSPVQESIHSPKGIGHGAKAQKEQDIQSFIGTNSNDINKLKQRIAELKRMRQSNNNFKLSVEQNLAQEKELITRLKETASNVKTSHLRDYNPLPKYNSYQSYASAINDIDRLSESQKDPVELTKLLGDLLEEYHPDQYKSLVSDDEYLIMTNEYSFILKELKLNGVLSQSGLLSFHNVVDPTIPLRSDPHSKDGLDLLKNFNEHLSVKSKTSRFCSEFNRFENVCTVTSFKDQLVEAALYKLDQKIADSKVNQLNIDTIYKSVKNVTIITDEILNLLTEDALLTIELLGKLKDLSQIDIKNFVDDLPQLLDFMAFEGVSIFNEVYDNKHLLDDYISYVVNEVGETIMTSSEEEVVRELAKLGYYGFLGMKGTSTAINADKLKKVISPETIKKVIGTKNITKTIEIVSSAKKLGVSSLSGLKSYTKLHDALKVLPEQLSVKRIRQGKGLDKVAIVGRNMGNVQEVAKGITLKTGLKVETFFDERAWVLFEDYVISYNRSRGFADNTYLPYTEVLKTELYKSNKKWAQKLKAEGYTVLDIGRPNKTLDKSAFYDIEKKLLFEEIYRDEE